MRIVFGALALGQFERLPVAIQWRVRAAVKRLEAWPEVSGIKWLGHEWIGHGRLRTGEYRVIFKREASYLVIVRIGHRKDVND